MIFFKTFFRSFLKGNLIGIGVLIPGLSGGTVAVLLLCFEQIIEAVANLKLHFKQSIYTLFPLLSGALISIWLIAIPLNNFCNRFPLVSKYTFIVISIISAFIFCVTTIQFKPRLGKLISLIIGIIIALLIDVLVRNYNLDQEIANPFLILSIGISLSFALILPGISFSYMLIFFGLYNRTLTAIETNDFCFILFLLIGIIFGSYIFTKLLYKSLNKYNQETYSLVFGFLIYSLCSILTK